MSFGADSKLKNPILCKCNQDVERDLRSSFFAVPDPEFELDFSKVFESDKKKIENDFVENVLSQVEFLRAMQDSVLIRKQIFSGVHQRLVTIENVLHKWILEKRDTYRNNPEFYNLTQTDRKKVQRQWTDYFDFVLHLLQKRAVLNVRNAAEFAVYNYIFEMKGTAISDEKLKKVSLQMIFELYRHHDLLDEAKHNFNQYFDVMFAK
ncbi:hypothetical protein HOH45_04780 [bacterium]|jgi:hypothetical protein|nr:hypothetical protein [bacterium]